MKAVRRASSGGSQTPWERLCGTGFAECNEGFLLVLDTDGRLVAASAGWHRRLRGWWSWDEGRRWREAVVQPEAARAWMRWTALLAQALAAEVPRQMEIVLRRADARGLRLGAVSQPLRDAAGRNLGAVVAGKFHSPPAPDELGAANAPPKPSTRRRRSDAWAEAARRLLVASGEQLVALESELRRAQRLATQGMLAAAIGHEVNNCLGIALANASLCREQHGGDSAVGRAVEPVIHALQAAGNICQRFNNLGGRGRTMPAVVDLRAVLHRSFEMLVRIVARTLTFEARDEQPMWVRADPTQLEQIVANLVLNARDATRAGKGRIHLAVGRAPPGDGAQVWFEVRDDGAGIPVEIQAKLFTAFFTTKPHRRGTGLGLATVQRLTHAMGGEIALTSEPGRGTLVRVVLPAAAEPVSPRTRVRRAANVAARSIRRPEPGGESHPPR